MDISWMVGIQIIIALVLNLALLAAEANADDEDEGPAWQGSNIFKMNDIIANIAHLKEHMGEVGYDWEHIDQEEAAFQYFSFHDLNADNKLDGLEILAALRHGAHDHYEKIFQRDLNPVEVTKRMNLLTDKLANTVDVVLKEDDTDDDGYLDYYEYATARKANKVLEQLDIKGKS